MHICIMSHLLVLVLLQLVLTTTLYRAGHKNLTQSINQSINPSRLLLHYLPVVERLTTAYHVATSPIIDVAIEKKYLSAPA